MVLDFRSDLFQNAQRLSLTFHDENATGGLMYRINNQADAMGSITTSIAPLLQALLTLGGMLYITIKIDLQLALLALTVVPLIYYSAGYYARKIEPKVNEVQTMEAQSLSIVYEAMAMMRVIRAFGRESYEYRRFREQGEVAVDARVGADGASDDVLARRQPDHCRRARPRSRLRRLQRPPGRDDGGRAADRHRATSLPSTSRSSRSARRSAACSSTSSHCAWRWTCSTPSLR